MISQNADVQRVEKMVWASRAAAYVFSVYGVLQGTVIILGGPNRFSAIGYRTAMAVPGAPPSWGWFLLVASLAAVIGVRMGKWRIGQWGMGACGLWSMFFAVTFAVSAVRYENANLTAMVTYGKDAVMFILISVIYHHRAKESRCGR